MISLYLDLKAVNCKKFTNSFLVVEFFRFRFITARLTLGMGTLIAFPESLPSSSGKAFDTALTAPVEVITMFNGALLPLLSPL